ncbi:MAG: MFS transporter [Holosporales bacterium]|jgi:MFS family permease|nr:MFS transporter [Holosporales bacterium]
MFWGIATSMVFSLLPIFIVDELHGTAKSFGLLEGAVTFFSFMAKLCAGFLMDIFRKKRPMLLTGAFLTVLSKLFLALSFNVACVFVAKSLDRFAKGLRHAPTDAILAEIAAKGGFAYSFRYMMIVLGAFSGSILTSFIVFSFGQNFRLIFAIAIIPTIIALFILKTKIKYKENDVSLLREKYRWTIKDVTHMPVIYWRFIVAVTFLMFNRFSEGFITLMAKDVLPNSVEKFPIFMAGYEVCAIITALVISKFADKIDGTKLLIGGVFIVFSADLFGIFSHNFYTVIAVYLLSGIHMGATQGLMASTIAKCAPKHLIGTAFALFYGIEGIALFISNYFAGISSHLATACSINPSSGPFMIGAIASLSAIICLYRTSLLQRRQLPEK